MKLRESHVGYPVRVRQEEQLQLLQLMMTRTALNRYSKVPLMPHSEILIRKLQSSSEGTPFAGYSGRARILNLDEAASLLKNGTALMIQSA